MLEKCAPKQFTYICLLWVFTNNKKGGQSEEDTPSKNVLNGLI